MRPAEARLTPPALCRIGAPKPLLPPGHCPLYANYHPKQTSSDNLRYNSSILLEEKKKKKKQRKEKRGIKISVQYKKILITLASSYKDQHSSYQTSGSFGRTQGLKRLGKPLLASFLDISRACFLYRQSDILEKRLLLHSQFVSNCGRKTITESPSPGKNSNQSSHEVRGKTLKTGNKMKVNRIPPPCHCKACPTAGFRSIF